MGVAASQTDTLRTFQRADKSEEHGSREAAAYLRSLCALAKCGVRPLRRSSATHAGMALPRNGDFPPAIHHASTRSGRRAARSRCMTPITGGGVRSRCLRQHRRGGDCTTAAAYLQCLRWVKTGGALVEHKISASSPKPDICALMSTRPSPTLAELLMPLPAANPFSTMRASLRWYSSEELEDGVTYGGQSWLRRGSVDSFFSALLLRDGDAAGRRKRSSS
jgi:hypothetical protein